MSVGPPDLPATDPARFVDGLLAWLSEVGRSRYDEQVSQLDHALQSAFLAVRAGDSDCAVAAALLHDVGHLLLAEHDGSADFLTTDLQHEAEGARWLSGAFPSAVSEPVRLHVAAKRYLCTVDSTYRERLSDASTRSYMLQGGALSADGLAEMEQIPELEAAITLRRRDDAAKESGRTVPGLESYRLLLEKLIVTA